DALDVLLLADVAGHGERAPALLLDHAGDVIDLLLGSRADDDVRAELVQPVGDGLADVAAGPGHDRHPVLELHEQPLEGPVARPESSDRPRPPARVVARGARGCTAERPVAPTTALV